MSIELFLLPGAKQPESPEMQRLVNRLRLLGRELYKATEPLDANTPLGSICTQAKDGVDIDGGTIDGATIGASDPPEIKATKFGLDVAVADQQAHIANPAGGGTQDTEARAAINAILVILETFGFTATA